MDMSMSKSCHRHPFDPGAQEKLRCWFCGGPACKHCGEGAYLRMKEPAIPKLHSTWISNSILAMQRPNDSLIHNADLIEQFKSNQITAIFNLTEPGEHPFCGCGVLNSGFPYSPEKFMANGIKHFNYSWTDMTAPSVTLVMDIVAVALSEIAAGGKVAVHCHAGYGRTGIVVACILIAMDRLQSDEAIQLVRLKRPGSVQTAKQQRFVQKFRSHYFQKMEVFYQSGTTLKGIAQSVRDQCDTILHSEMSRQRILRWVHKVVPGCTDSLIVFTSDAPTNFASVCEALCGWRRMREERIQGRQPIDVSEQVLETLINIERDIDVNKWKLFNDSCSLLQDGGRGAGGSSPPVIDIVTTVHPTANTMDGHVVSQPGPQSQGDKARGGDFDTSLSCAPFFLSQLLLDYVEARSEALLDANAVATLADHWTAAAAADGDSDGGGGGVEEGPGLAQGTGLVLDSLVAASVGPVTDDDRKSVPAQKLYNLWKGSLETSLDSYKLHLLHEMVKFLRHLKSQVRGASSKEMAESRESSDSRVLSSEVAKVDSTVYSSTFSLLQSEKASPSSPSSPSLPSSSGREGQTPQTGEAGEAGNGAVPRSEEMKGDRSRGQGGGKSPSADHGVQQISFVQQQDALYFLTVMRLAVATTMACHDEGARSMCLAGNGRALSELLVKAFDKRALPDTHSDRIEVLSLMRTEIKAAFNAQCSSDDATDIIGQDERPKAAPLPPPLGPSKSRFAIPGSDDVDALRKSTESPLGSPVLKPIPPESVKPTRSLGSPFVTQLRRPTSPWHGELKPSQESSRPECAVRSLLVLDNVFVCAQLLHVLVDHSWEYVRPQAIRFRSTMQPQPQPEVQAQSRAPSAGAGAGASAASGAAGDVRS